MCKNGFKDKIEPMRIKSKWNDERKSVKYKAYKTKQPTTEGTVNHQEVYYDSQQYKNSSEKNNIHFVQLRFGSPISSFIVTGML